MKSNVYPYHSYPYKSPNGNIIYRNNNGRYHREDGPAIIWSCDGSVSWCLNDEEYETPEEMPLNLFLAYCKWEYNKNGS